MIFFSLLNNIALLVSLSIVYSWIARRWDNRTHPYQVLSGLLFGSVALVGMFNPVVLMPGLIFDGRSIIISIAGLFGGPITALITVVMTAGYRLWLGGPGVWMGVAVISESALVGITMHYLRRRQPNILTPVSLWLFSLVVHILMLLCANLLPPDQVAKTLAQITLPVLTIYPIGSLLVCLLFLDLEARQKATADLAASEKKYRGLYENLIDGFVRVDLEGHYREFNQAYLNIVGYTADEIRSKTFIELTPEKWRDWEAKILHEQVMEQGYADIYAKEYRRKDGSLVPVELRTYLDRDEQGKPIGYWAIVQDISERKHAEDTLRESEERFRSYVVNAPDGIFIVDNTGNYLDVNPAACQLTGYDREELVGSSISKLVPEGEGAASRARFGRLVEGGRISFEMPLKHKDGHIIHCILDAVRLDPQRLIGFVKDISDRKQAEEKFSKAFMDNPSPMGITDGESGAVYDVNEAFLERFGYTRHEIIGKTILEINLFENEDERRRMVRAILKTGRLRDYEVVMRTQSGERLTILYSGDLMHLSQKQYILSVMVDITERRKTEALVQQQKEMLEAQNEELLGQRQELMEAHQALQRLNSELEARVAERSARLLETSRELEAFTYTISHDLRTPLRAIHGFTRILQDEYSSRLGKEGKAFLQRILAASQRMSWLIDGLLQLAGITRNEIRPSRIDLSVLAWQAIHEIQKQHSGRQVEWVVEPGMTAWADEGLILTAYKHLLNNAWKFTDNQPSARIEAGTCEKDSRRVFYVRDNGIGFDMAYVGKLFGTFQRLHNDEAYEGTGIGLAVVSRIIRRHAGEIWAESSPGQGATFYFTLPEKSG